MLQLESIKTRAESSTNWLKSDQWYPTNKENLQIIGQNNWYVLHMHVPRHSRIISNIKVNRGKWLGRPINIKEADNQATIYVENSLTLHIFFILIDYAWVT